MRLTPPARLPTALPTALLLASTCTFAQPPAAPQTLPTVTTELQRDSNVAPYSRINELLTKLGQHGEGQFRMDFKVDAEKTKLPLSAVKLAVRSDEADHPVKIDSEGRFDLPVLPAAEAKTAEFATNVPKGQMAIRGTLQLTATPEQLDMARVRQLMRVARTLREELLPWYLRWLFPRIEAVRVCSPTPTWELEWRENGQLMGLPLPVAANERDPDAANAEKGRPCTLLTGQERWPDAARLVAPAGTTLSVKLQGS